MTDLKPPPGIWNAAATPIRHHTSAASAPQPERAIVAVDEKMAVLQKQLVSRKAVHRHHRTSQARDGCSKVVPLKACTPFECKRQSASLVLFRVLHEFTKPS